MTLNIVTGVTGETNITAQLWLGGAFVGSAIALSETPSGSRVYNGAVPNGTAAGEYIVVFSRGGIPIGSGPLSWNGTSENFISTRPTLAEIEASSVIAKESTSGTINTRVQSIPTNPLLSNDSRLNNLNAPIADRPTLTQIEASTVIAKESTSGTINTKVQTIPSNPLLTNDSRLNNLNAPIADRPTLSQIEASTVLAKEATSNTINTRVQSIPTSPLLSTDNRLNNLNAPIADRPTLTQIEASTVLAKTSGQEALSSQIGSPLQSGDYVVPPNTTQITSAVVSGLSSSFSTLSTQIGSPVQTTDTNLTTIPQVLTGVSNLLKVRIPASGQSVSVKAPTVAVPGYVRTSDNSINLVWTRDDQGVETLAG